ncbi:hypothetical protein HDV62DRAFT_404200 [Trichoderma sp. SZMC 28011]
MNALVEESVKRAIAPLMDEVASLQDAMASLKDIIVPMKGRIASMKGDIDLLLQSSSNMNIHISTANNGVSAVGDDEGHNGYFPRMDDDDGMDDDDYWAADKWSGVNN